MDLLVSVISPIDFDLNVYSYWTEGKTVEEALTVFPGIEQQAASASLFNFQRRNYKVDIRELLKHEIRDQYQLFSQLEHYLRQPILLLGYSPTNVCPLRTAQIREFCIEKYWSLDDIIVREVVSKQRLTKTRKDLDDICENTQLSIVKVTRQFDNLKNVFNFLEEKQFAVKMIDAISNSFCLKGFLLRKYVCIMFLLNSRFTLTSKKRIQRVSCESLELCAASILSCLTISSSTFFTQGRTIYNSKILENSDIKDEDREVEDSSSDILSPNILASDVNCWHIIWGLFRNVNKVDIDKDLLGSLREIRTIITGELLDIGVAHVRKEILERSTTMMKKLDPAKIRSTLKILMQIGSCLSQTSEFRDLFEDLLSKIVEPLEEHGLTAAEIHSFLICCNEMIQAYPEEVIRNYLASTRPSSNSISSNTSAGSANETSKSESQSTKSMDIASKRTKGTSLRKDWLRFLICCRLCIMELMNGDPTKAANLNFQYYRINL